MKHRMTAAASTEVSINPDLLNNDKSLRHLVDQYNQSTAELRDIIRQRKYKGKD